MVEFKSFFFFSSRRRHTRLSCDWSSDVCSSDHTSELQSHDNLVCRLLEFRRVDRKSTRLNSSHTIISYAVFCLKKKPRRSRRTAHRPPSSVPLRRPRFACASLVPAAGRSGGVRSPHGSRAFRPVVCFFFNETAPPELPPFPPRPLSR